jgi:hypothetical protein
MPRLLPLLLAASAASTVLSCSSDIDCQLNGACTSSGTCACRPGWTGSDCGQLDFLPAPTTHAFYRNDSASWGFSILEENGVWYAFLAYMLGNCGLNAWQDNSAIYRAVSVAGPAGPYVNETMVLPWFGHNPTVSRHPDGSLLIWHIGNGAQQGHFNNNCTNGTTPKPPPPPPPPPMLLVNNGSCLVPSGTFPCWTGDGTFEVCPVILGSCDDPAAQWSIEPEQSAIVSHAYPGSGLNIDCDSCNASAVAKRTYSRRFQASCVVQRRYRNNNRMSAEVIDLGESWSCVACEHVAWDMQQCRSHVFQIVKDSRLRRPARRGRRSTHTSCPFCTLVRNDADKSVPCRCTK